MAKQVPIGTRGAAQERVQFENTLTSHHHQLPPVFSTPSMIELMETAGMNALQPYCELGEISVGTAINIEHRAPVGVNSVVKAEAEVVEFDGRFYTLRVKVTSGELEIGLGKIYRAIVNVNSFMEKWGIPRP
jgi:predicted thioesterase